MSPGDATAGSDGIDVVISVEEDRLAAVDQIAADLAGAGLRDPQVLRAVGVISGRVPDAATLEALRAVSGVGVVEVSGEIQLPPPEEDVQ